MDNIVAIGIGLGMRAIIDYVAHESYIASAIVGVWEGVVLNHFLAKFPTSVDPYVAFAFRLFVDYLFTKSMTRLFITVLWTGLGMLLSGVAVEMSADRRFRRLWRQARRTLPFSWLDPTPRSRSSRVRFSPRSAGSRTTIAQSPTIPPVPVRETTHPVPGQFDQYSEISVPTVTGRSSTAPSEAEGAGSLHSSVDLRRPRTPSELEYIDPLPVIPDAHDHVDLDPRRQTVPPNTGVLYNPDDTDAPSIRTYSGMTTPVNEPISLPGPADDANLPRIHSGLTTPEYMHTHTEGLPPINIYDAGNPPIADLPEQSPVPIRLKLVTPSPPLVPFPEPQLTPGAIPPTSEIPNIPTPDDPPPSFAEATQAAHMDADMESTLGEGSVISVTGGRDTIIAKADAMRQQALQQEKERDRIRGDLKRARADGRHFDVLRLELEYEDAHDTATQLHAKAARRYFRAHNLARQPQEVDVHRLTVPEANIQVKRALKEALETGASELRIITGRGNHSRNKIPVLKLAIIQEMNKYHIQAEPDSSNPGVLVIRIPPTATAA